ncbi:MAG: DUF134 domain-containing protein [Firmicutes bacterium]|jgi:predicted DNA-binding protein (UPF0251 family)|nr:DUF134 domain-containing protein [Bacillota bacterium]
MPRPPKLRRVEFVPQVTVFKPAGVSLRDLEEEVLTVEELEAIRLKDLEGLEQEECAERMQVSRPTFQRVLSSAREKVARALVEGKAIRFEGGTYRLALGQFRCGSCSYEFEAPFAAPQSGADPACPHCGAERGKRIGHAGYGHGHGHGPGHCAEHGAEHGPDSGTGPEGERWGRCGRRWGAAQGAQGVQGVERDASRENPSTMTDGPGEPDAHGAPETVRAPEADD